MKVLIGHTSFETAFIQDDYPYGFRERCRRAVWVETKKGHGQRFVTRTTNPKKGDKWNAPKAGTYMTICVMFIDDAGLVEHTGIGGYAADTALDAFETLFGATFDDWQMAAMNYLRAKNRAEKRMKWTVTSGPSEGPHQTRAEQDRLVRGLIDDEMRKGK